MKKKILFISDGYPWKESNAFVFVKKLVDAVADEGMHCSVISPKSICNGLFRIQPIPPKYCVYETINGAKVEVYRPRTVSFSNLRIGKFKLSSWFSTRAIRRTARNLRFQPDIYYGHFWASALSIYPVARKANLPLFVATGESTIPSLDGYSMEHLENFSKYVSGVVCVSTKNKLESVGRKLTTEEKTIVLPNAVDFNYFYKKKKDACRCKLGLPLDAFIVCFVGGLIERKGPLRVSAAIDNLLDNSVKSLFIGSGNQVPNCSGILYKGAVLHNDLSDYLNAADVFVLPTLHEGCCNAIIEAMACGLPIISSNLPFNDDILTDKNSIRVDPNSVSEISEAIKKLQSDVKLREKMGQESLQISEGLKIEIRSQKILEFIASNISLRKSL